MQLRARLTAILSDTTPFVPGPLAGKYPENATVGQVAATVLADIEAMWTAEAYEPRCHRNRERKRPPVGRVEFGGVEFGTSFPLHRPWRGAKVRP